MEDFDIRSWLYQKGVIFKFSFCFCVIFFFTATFSKRAGGIVGLGIQTTLYPEEAETILKGRALERQKQVLLGERERGALGRGATTPINLSLLCTL